MANSIDIKDINFSVLTDADKKLITDYRNNSRKKSLKNRTFISVAVFIFLMVFEIFGRYIQNRRIGYELYSINTAIFAFIFLFIIFNICSFVYFYTKCKLEDFAGDTVITDGVITRLLGKKQVKEEAKASYKTRMEIWKKQDKKTRGKKPVFHAAGSFQGNVIPNYLFFACDQGDCSTTLKISDNKKFNSLKKGDKIKIIRFSLNDIVQYDIYISK